MARLLFVGSGNPWQGGAGYLVRQSLFLTALGEVGELHLAMFDYKSGPVPPYVKSVTSLSKPGRSGSSKWKNLFADLTDPLPRMMRGYDMTEPRQQLVSLNPLRFEAVFAFRIDFAYFAGVLNHPRLILDIDDPEHVRGERRLQTQQGNITDPRTLRDLQKLRQFELNAVAGAKLAFVCQENDCGGWGIPPEVIPNCVTILPNPSRAVTKPVVLFVGNMVGGNAAPNVDAVRFFLGDVWPKILQAVPEAEFQLIGAFGDTVKHLATNAPRTQLLGFVDDLADAYSKAMVSIAPIRFGTGTRIKILESFAHACPVVSTLAGAEGIDAVPGQEIELATDAEDFSAALVSMLNDRTRAEQIGKGGYELAQREYDAGVQREKLIKRLRQFLNERVRE